MTGADDPQYGPNTDRVLAVIRRACELTPDEVAALDSAEASVHPQIERAWEDLRTATSAEPWRGWCLAAGNDAWDALAVAAGRAGIGVPSARTAPEDAFWRVVSRPGFGAARAACLAASALVGRPGTDLGLRGTFSGPWHQLVGDLDDPRRSDSRARRELFDDFKRNHPAGEPFDDSWFPRGYHGAAVLAPNTACDFAPGSVVWRCFENHGHPFELTDPLEGAVERLEADIVETSAQVPCDGPASAQVAFAYPEVELVVCGSHEQWLRRHQLLGGLDSWVLERMDPEGLPAEHQQIVRLGDEARFRAVVTVGAHRVPFLLPVGTELVELGRTYVPTLTVEYVVRSGPYQGLRVYWEARQGGGLAPGARAGSPS